MPYLIERTRALCDKNIVAVLNVRKRGVRTQLILKDNSLHHTRTRTRTLIHRANVSAARRVTEYLYAKPQ